MKGSNLVPNDMINAAMTSERYEKLVALAQEANFNFRGSGAAVFMKVMLCMKFAINAVFFCGRSLSPLVLLYPLQIKHCLTVSKKRQSIKHEGFPVIRP